MSNDKKMPTLTPRQQLLTPRQLYRQITVRKWWVLLGGTAVLLTLFIIDIITGPAWLSPAGVFSTLLSPQQATPKDYTIVWVIRAPIAVMALLVGASLGTAGAELQTILDNPLASPYTLGISSAASFGAALAIVLGKSLLPVRELFIVPLNAFAFAMLSSLCIYAIAKVKQAAAGTIVLTGIVFSFLFNSLVSFLQYIARENEFQAIMFWMFGSLQSANWTKVALVAGVLLITLPILFLDAWKLTALTMGDHRAQSMGINTSRLRFKIILLVSVLTAIPVCFVGTIGFVGLVAPHVARFFTGEDQRFFLPCSALAGAIMLSFASIVSKTILPGSIFPVGITTSFIGIPFLLFILLRQKKSYL